MEYGKNNLIVKVMVSETEGLREYALSAAYACAGQSGYINGYRNEEGEYRFFEMKTNDIVIFGVQPNYNNEDINEFYGHEWFSYYERTNENV